MAIWRTSPPNPSDFPIWAYTLSDSGTLDKLRLYESLGELMVDDKPLVWTTVQVPLPPVGSTPQSVIDEFQRLADDPDTSEWSSSDWFIAGYNQATGLNDDSNSCGCSQDKCSCKSPEWGPGAHI